MAVSSRESASKVGWELGRGMSGVQYAGEFKKDFLTQQSYISGSTIEQQLKSMKELLYRKLEKPFVIFFIFVVLDSVRYR